MCEELSHQIINTSGVNQAVFFLKKILSRANSFIANNNIRSVKLEIKNDRCKIVKTLIFRSLSREQERNVLGKENEILVF